MAKKILIIMGTRPEAIKLAPLFLVQEEASILKKKIIILRDKTERQDVLKDFGILVGSNKRLIIKHTLNNINNTNKLKRIKSPFGKIGLSNIIAKTIIKLI